MTRDHFRTFSHQELRTILLASAGAGGFTYLAVLLMILTGQRLGQVLRLEWKQLDLHYAYWHRTPRAEAHRTWAAPPLPLSTLTTRLLGIAAELPRLDGDRVLCRPGAEDKMQQKMRADVNRQLLETTGASFPWNTHAFRRSFAEGCYRIGATERQIELALDMAPRWPGEKVFLKPADILKLFRPVAECWAMEIEQLLEPKGVDYDCLMPPKTVLKVVK